MIVDSFNKTQFNKDKDQFMKNFDWYWPRKSTFKLRGTLSKETDLHHRPYEIYHVPASK